MKYKSVNTGKPSKNAVKSSNSLKTNNVKKKSTSPDQANAKGQIYILAGALRGKKLQVINSPGLRPIGSRVKEIFFNWIQFDIANRHVLDLFSGSGALGFEALSRGCKSLQMFEYTKSVYDTLLNNYRSLNLQELNKAYGFIPQVNIKLTDSYAEVAKTSPKQYDLVFVDPPFMQEKELTVLNDLAKNNFLADQALIFLQLDLAYEGLVQQLDSSRFSQKKFKKSGNILLYLFEYNANN